MALLNKYGFTAKEMEYLMPDPIKKMNRISRLEWHVRVWGLLFVGIVSILHFTVEPRLLPKSAHAEVATTTEPVRQNDYYCENLGSYMLGDKVFEIVNYCETL